MMMNIKVTEVYENPQTTDISVAFVGTLNLSALSHLKEKAGEAAMAALGMELSVQLMKSLDEQP